MELLPPLDIDPDSETSVLVPAGNYHFLMSASRGLQIQHKTGSIFHQRCNKTMILDANVKINNKQELDAKQMSF